MSALNENNFNNRVDVLQIPEGWRSIAYELVLRIDEYLEINNYGPKIIKEWKITSLDINKNGKLVLTGTHIKNFIEPITDVAKIAESVCCICGNDGTIENTKHGIKLPLCKFHLVSANAI